MTAEEITRALGGHWHGSYGTARCPCHDDHKESLSITDGKNAVLFKCFVECTSTDIAREVARRLKPNGEARELVHAEFGWPAYVHRYFNPDRTLRFVACRFEWPDKPKEIRYAVPDGAGWRWKIAPGPRPPYRLLEALAEPDCGILIVEGEKKADIAAKLFLEWVVVGWAGGAAAWAKTDWALLPAGREIAIWPDNDPPGIKAAQGIASRFEPSGSVRIIDVAALGLPAKWDLGDPLPPGLDPEAVVNAAKPIPTQIDPKLPESDTNVFDPPPWDMPGETAPNDKPRFVLERFNTLTVPDDPYYLVKGILPAHGLAVIWGPPKCGKSFWTLDLMLHVALGLSYRARKTRQGPVVYIACEGGDWFGARIEAYRQCFLGEDADPPFFLVRGSLDLIKDHKRLSLEIAAQCPNPAAVAIDTVNASLGGSEVDDMTDYTKAAKFLAETLGCVVPVVHHCGLSGERPRGHTSLQGNCDAQIAVAKANSGLVTATVELMKDGIADAVIKSRIRQVDLGTDSDGGPRGSCVIDPADAEPSATRPARHRLGRNQELALLILEDAGQDGLDQEDWNARMAEAGIEDKQRQSETRLRLKAKKLAREYNGRWHAHSPSKDPRDAT